MCSTDTVLIVFCIFFFQILWKVRHCCLWEIRTYLSLSLENLLVSLFLDKIFSTIYPLRSKHQWTFCIRKEQQTPPQTVVYVTVPYTGFWFSLFTWSVYVFLNCLAFALPFDLFHYYCKWYFSKSFTKTNHCNKNISLVYSLITSNLEWMNHDRAVQHQIKWTYCAEMTLDMK